MPPLHSIQTWEVSAEYLAKIWRIFHDDAAWMLEVTTQLLHTNDGSSLSRNAGTDDRAVRYKKLWSTFFSDTLFATKKAKSLQGNTCAQLHGGRDDSILSAKLIRIAPETSSF